MKRRLRDKYIIILLIATSFLSVLYYINKAKIISFETQETDYNTNDSFLENTFSLGTSNDQLYTFFIENAPKTNMNCSIDEFLEKNEEILCIFIAGTNLSLDFLILLKNLLKHKVLKEEISQEIEVVKLTSLENRILNLIQDFLSTNRVFNKEKVAMYIKSRFHTNGNLNYIGINGVLDSLIKKKAILEGSKLTSKTLLLNTNRLQIFNLIKEKPGIYRNKLVKYLNLCSFVVNWHLSILKRFHLIRERDIEGHLCYFKSSQNSLYDNVYHTIFKDQCKRIIDYLDSNNKGCTKYRIAKALNMHFNTISKYLNKLEEFDLLIKEREANKELIFLNSINFKKIMNFK